MNIEGIRNAFSKGGIVFSKDGIAVFYTFKDRWVSQSLQDEDLGILIGLLESCDEVIIECNIGRVFKIIFHDKISGQEIVFYPPLEEEVSIQELHDMLQTTQSETADSEFFEFFVGVDLNDGDAVFEKCLEFVESKKSRESNVTNFDSAIRWKIIKKDVIGIANSLFVDYVLNDPENGNDGFSTVYFDNRERSRITISGKSKRFLEEAIRNCSVVDIECNVNKGFLNLSLFS